MLSAIEREWARFKAFVEENVDVGMKGSYPVAPPPFLLGVLVVWAAGFTCCTVLAFGPVVLHLLGKT